MALSTSAWEVYGKMPGKACRGQIVVSISVCIPRGRFPKPACFVWYKFSRLWGTAKVITKISVLITKVITKHQGNWNSEVPLFEIEPLPNLRVGN